MDGYTGDYNYNRYTPVDNTGTNQDVFRSAYKNIRFGVETTQQIQLTQEQAANLPGLAYQAYGDTSLFRALLAFNGLSDPISDVAVGLIFSIPTKADLNKYLTKQQNNPSNNTIVI